MNLSPNTCGKRALTLTEVLCVVVAVLFLAALALTFLAKEKGGRLGSHCGNNLRMINLAFKVWANDNDDKFPYFTTNCLAFTNETQAWLHFQTMSNELGSALILACPQDAQRRTNAVSEFDSGPNGLRSKGNRAVSYFIGLDADETRPHSLNAGDRNVFMFTNFSPTTGAVLVLSSNVPPGWTGEVHTNAGYLVDASGDVFFRSNPGLRTALPFPVEVATNRLLLPLIP